jgi:hypothetical protein
VKERAGIHVLYSDKGLKWFAALIKKKIIFSFLSASSYMVKYLLDCSYIRKPFLINDFALDPF